MLQFFKIVISNYYGLCLDVSPVSCTQRGQTFQRWLHLEYVMLGLRICDQFTDWSGTTLIPEASIKYKRGRKILLKEVVNSVTMNWSPLQSHHTGASNYGLKLL